MMTVFRRMAGRGAVVSIVLFTVGASAQKPLTAFDRQLARIDLGVSGAGSFTTNTTGNSYLPQLIVLKPSTTLGALVQLRYTKSPLLGLEINYGFVRYTDDFTVSNTTGTPPGNVPYVLGAQTKASEYSVGYVVHAPGTYFGVKPFAGVGVGGLYFTPTGGGGQGLPKQPRGVYFYEVGAEAPVLSPNFGVRLQFRQQFFGAPDYNQNYLATNKRSVTTQPTFGFFLRF